MTYNFHKTSLGKASMAAIAIFGFGLAANATPVTFTFDSFTKSRTTKANLNGEYINNLHMGNINVSIYDPSTGTSAKTVAYCMEIAETISIGEKYTGYTSTDLASAGLSQSQAKLAGILYDLYYDSASASNASSTDAAAFQLALWELTHDDDGSIWKRSGDFYVYDDHDKVANKADSYLQDVKSAAKNNHEPYTEIVALTNAGHQDVVVLAGLRARWWWQSHRSSLWRQPRCPALRSSGLLGWRRLRKRINTRNEQEQVA